MSKDELEREAGGKIFTSENEETRNQVENTRYQGGSSSYDQSSGATETRLTENKQYESSSASGSESGGSSMGGGAQIYQGGNSGYRSSYEYENSISSGSNSGGSGSYSGSSSSRGAITQSEWKLLDNGTYIKVYHTKSTAAGGGGRNANTLDNSGNNYDSGSSDSGWVTRPDGTRHRQQSSWSSWSSSTGTGVGGGGVTYDNRNNYGSGYRGGMDDGKNYDSGNSDSGWVTMPDGSRRREQSSWSSSSSVFSTGDSGSTSRERNRVAPDATETRLSSSSSSSSTNKFGSSNVNNIFGAARGPGDYHGTMRKDELENEAGGKVFGSSNSETRNQVENTRYQGSSYQGSGYQGSGYQGSNNNQQGSGGGASYREGSYYDQENRAKYDSGGKSRTGQSSFSSTSRDSSSDGGQNLFGSGYSSSSSSQSSSSSSSGSGSSLPKGQWVWDQSADDGKGKWEWSTTTVQESHSSVTKTSGSQGGGRTSSDGSYTSFSSGTGGNVNYDDRGYVIQPDGTIRDSNSNWNSNYAGGRQNGRTSYREESSYGGVRLNSEDADEISKHFAHGEILDHQGIGHETGDLGRDSTGE